MSKGASKAPVIYDGTWDSTKTYLPLTIVTLSGTAYLSIATSTGVSPDSDPAQWLPLGGGGGGSVTPGGQKTLDVAWTSGQVFPGSGTAVYGADHFTSTTDAAAAIDSTSGTQILLCTDGVPATYHVAITPYIYRSSFVGLATRFAAYMYLDGWFGYQQSGPPPGTVSIDDFWWYSFSGFKHCSPGQAINLSDLIVRVIDDVGNSYRAYLDNAAMVITRMPA